MILLLGAKGRLGRVIASYRPDFIAWDKTQLDITNRHAVIEQICKLKPSLIINCSGFTDVDACESHVQECWNVNVYGVKNIVEACLACNAHLIHISSNYAVNPVNEYSWTKKASEKFAEEVGLVIRTDFYTSESFVIHKLLFEKGAVPVFTDRTYNPISVYGLAQEVISRTAKKDRGIINIGIREKISPLQLAEAICDEFKINKHRLKAVTSTQKGAQRSKDLYIKPVNKLSLKNDVRLFSHELQRQENSRSFSASR